MVCWADLRTFFAFAVLLFKLQFLLFFDFLLNFSVEIVCAIGTHLVPDEHGLYDVVQILFGGLTVLLVKREEDEREHDDHHQHCRRGQVEMRLRQKEDRDADCRSDGKTNELPLGQIEHDLRFNAVKILRDRNKCHCLFPPFRE